MLAAASSGALALAVSLLPSTASASVVTPATPGSAVSGAPAPTVPSSPATPGQIAASEAQVAAIESRITQQQRTLNLTDEEYNQAVIDLTSTRASLQATSAAMTTDQATLQADRSRLRSDAIAAYVTDSSSGSIADLFASPGNADEARTMYNNVAVGDIARAVAAVRTGQERVRATQTVLLAEQRTESTQVAQASQASQEAATATQAAQATLAEVKGTLAQQIAQQAAAQAAQAAQAAAAARSQHAAQAAALQAAQAAQVAATVGATTATGTTAGESATTTAAATAAANAANQAAGAASGSGTVAIASGGSPQAAGLAAVHGAMQYLGVPYVWGGASRAGVDCSGLVMLAWEQAGVSLEHSAAAQYDESTHVSLSALEPGDLLFYNLDGTGIDHVVMYVGPTLDGHPTPYGASTIIQASEPGTVVSYDPFWSYGLVGAGRP